MRAAHSIYVTLIKACSLSHLQPQLLLNEYNVKIIDKVLDGILGIELKHNISDFSFCIYSCYLPPENSPHGRDAVQFYTHLLSEMYIHGESDAILICGDLNSRIGHMKDTIDDIDQIPQRTVIDSVINQHGNVLIEFLEESKMCIANGRFNSGEDDFTCRTCRGLSVVDYFIVPHDMLRLALTFKLYHA